MKKKIKYTNETLSIGKRVRDFLPSPEELVLRTKTKRITLNVNEASLTVFKKEARRLGVPYQKLLRTIVDLYAQQHLK